MAVPPNMYGVSSGRAQRRSKRCRQQEQKTASLPSDTAILDIVREHHDQ